MLAEHGMPPNSRPAMTREERLGGTRDEWIDTYKKAMCDCDETRGVGPSTVCEVAQIRVTIRKPKGCGERWASRWAGRHGKMDRVGGGGGAKRLQKGNGAVICPHVLGAGGAGLGLWDPGLSRNVFLALSRRWGGAS